jgi:hypothetical protein
MKLKGLGSALPSPNLLTRPTWPTDLQLGKISGLGQTQWKRGREIAGSSLFGSTPPAPHDVEQGSLGSCYLLSSLSLLAGVKDYLQTQLFMPRAGERGE